MPIPVWTVADFFSAFQLLLPQGRAWPRDPGAVETQGLQALMPTYVRSANSARNLLIDGFPATTVQLLPEWEASLGLPDSCSSLATSLQQQQGAVVEKFTRGGGQSIGYYIGVAARLGYTITITEGAASTFTWTVHGAPVAQNVLFRAGEGRAGDLLETLGTNAFLQCVLNKIKPAHTTLLFSSP